MDSVSSSRAPSTTPTIASTIHKPASNVGKRWSLSWTLIHGCIFFQGISTHIPLHALFTATPYYKARLISSHNNHLIDTVLAKTFLSHFSLCYMSVKLVFLFASMALSKKMAARTRASIAGWTICILITCFLLMAVSDSIWDPSLSMISSNAFYRISLTLIGCLAFASAWHDMALIDLLADLPSSFTQALLTGHASSGVVMCVQSLCLLYIRGENTDHFTPALRLAINYFSMTLAMCLVAMFMYHLLFFTFQKHLTNIKTKQSEYTLSTTLSTRANVKTLLRLIWREALAGFIVHSMNSFVYPPLMSLIQPPIYDEDKNLSSLPTPSFFLPLTFLMWNISDWLSKSFVGLVTQFKEIPLLLFASLRLLLLLGYFGFVKGYIGKCPMKPFLFYFTYYTLVAFSALTSGYLNSMGLFYTARKVKKLDPVNTGRAVSLVVIIGLIGTMIGALFGLIVNHLIVINNNK